MTTVESTPTHNILPLAITKWSKDRQWSIFSEVVGKLIDRFVIVRNCSSISTSCSKQPTVPEKNTPALVHDNPHCMRIYIEHSYCIRLTTITPKISRNLPHFLLRSCAADVHGKFGALQMQQESTDGVFSYACTVLNDGLLLSELRDAIHHGDGPRIIRCWKFMLLYFKAYNHHKYALEAFRLLVLTNGISSPLVKEQITWSRTVNTQGGRCNNIPIDLFNEHLNRTLKDCILGMGANLTEDRIVSLSRAMECISSICLQADKALGLHQSSLHHTVRTSIKDEQLIIEELLNKSNVFEYVPGRSHHSHSSIQPCISKTVDAKKLISWIHNQKVKLKSDFQFTSFLNPDAKLM